MVATETKAIQEIEVSIETISPALALQYLETMPGNRKLNETRVAKIAADIQADAWIASACGVLHFDTDGHLMDGQHRLWGLIKANVEMCFAVIRNVPFEGMYVIDSGRPRTLADALRIDGHTNEFALAGAIHFYAEWLGSGMVQKITTTSAITTAQGIRLLTDNPGISDSVRHARSITSKIRGGPGRWGCIAYILSNIEPDDAEAFFDALVTGQDLNAASPILQLRKRLLDDVTSLRKIQIREYTALVFKAWNLWRKGTTTPRRLVWVGGGKRKEDYPIPE